MKMFLYEIVKQYFNVVSLNS